VYNQDGKVGGLRGAPSLLLPSLTHHCSPHLPPPCSPPCWTALSMACAARSLGWTAWRAT
jgi:hypothetical protein